MGDHQWNKEELKSKVIPKIASNISTIGPWWKSYGQRARSHSEDPSSNPADAYSFSVNFVCEKRKIIN